MSERLEKSQKSGNFYVFGNALCYNEFNAVLGGDE